MDRKTPFDVCLTASELAARWRCRIPTVRQFIRDGRLKTITINGTLRILPESIRDCETRHLSVMPPPRRRRPRRKDPAVAEASRLLDLDGG